MVKAPENRSQGNRLKETRQFSRGEKKARQAGCERLLSERKSPLSVQLSELSYHQGGWTVIEVLGSERFQLKLKLASLKNQQIHAFLKFSIPRGFHRDTWVSQ